MSGTCYAVSTSASPSPNYAETAAREVHAMIPADFMRASGERLAGTVQARLIGPEGAPLVVIAGGISSGRHLYRNDEGQPGWWSWAVRPGGPVDLNHVRVLAFDYLPGRGQGRLTITTHDQARLLAVVLDHLGVRRIDALIGASYGGAVGLAFAEALPDRIDRLVVISAAHRSHPMATAVRGIQRRILAFGADSGRESEGVALARELAMTTYRTPEEFALRFASTPPEQAGEAYPVCGYLAARSADYDQVMSVDRWISLSDSMDRHSVAPERITTPLTLIGFTSDSLVPITDVRDLADRAACLDRLIAAPSIFGHDAFLKERDLIAGALRDALATLPQPTRTGIAA